MYRDAGKIVIDDSGWIVGNVVTIEGIDNCWKLILNTTPSSAIVETPITPVDTNSINLTVSGVNNHTIQADAKISATSWNAISIAFDWLYVPAWSAPYTDEQAQDAVGSILVDTSTIDFTYNDATPSITANVLIPALVSTDANNRLTIWTDSKLFSYTSTPDFSLAW